MDITERVLRHPRNQDIVFRGVELDDFLESLGDEQMWFDTGEKLKDFLRRQKPTVIYGRPSPPPFLDEIVRTGFGNVYARDWYFET